MGTRYSMIIHQSVLQRAVTYNKGILAILASDLSYSAWRKLVKALLKYQFKFAVHPGHGLTTHKSVCVFVGMQVYTLYIIMYSSYTRSYMHTMCITHIWNGIGFRFTYCYVRFGININVLSVGLVSLWNYGTYRKYLIWGKEYLVPRHGTLNLIPIISNPFCVGFDNP